MKKLIVLSILHLSVLGFGVYRLIEGHILLGLFLVIGNLFLLRLNYLTYKRL